MVWTRCQRYKPHGLAGAMMVVACWWCASEAVWAQPAAGETQQAAGETQQAAVSEARQEECGRFEVDSEVLAAADRAIHEPDSEEQVPELLVAIERHPYHQEVVRRLKAAGGSESGSTAHRYKQADGAYAPERAKLHVEIVEQLLNPAARAKEGQKPIAILVVGLPGAGKTTIVAPWPKRLGIACTTANADDIQNRLPEYQGWNADLLHAEAHDTLEQTLLPRAIAQRHHLVVDVTGRDSERTVGVADELGRHDYQIYLINVRLPAGKAAYRAWRRFRKGAFRHDAGDPDAGRFVAPRFVATEFGPRPDEAYAALKRHPAVVHWLEVSTAAGPGGPASVEEEGSRGEQAPKDR